MKVCILCPGWPGKINQWNGIFIQEQAKNLVKNGCRVTVVTARVYNEDPSIELDGEINVNRFWFPSKRKLLAEHKKIPFIRIGLYLIFGILKTYRVVRKEKTDIIHAHWAIPTGFIGIIAGKLLRKPVILTAHDSDITVWSQKSFIANKIIRYTLRSANLILAVTSTLKDFMVEHLNTDPKKISVVPLGIDTNLFTPQDQEQARQKLGLPHDKKIALFIGGLLEIKGIRYLMQSIPKVLQKCNDLLFVFIGAGPLENFMKEEIKKHKINDKVLIYGPKPHQEIPLWLGAADILLLPSLSEGLPMVIAEALAMGVPVIASKVGGIPEIVTHNQNAFLIEPRNIETIVENIVLFFTDNKESDLLKKNAVLDQRLDNKISAKMVTEIYYRIKQEISS